MFCTREERTQFVSVYSVIYLFHIYSISQSDIFALSKEFYNILLKLQTIIKRGIFVE